METFGYKTAYCLKSLVKNLLFAENERMSRIDTPDFSVHVVRSSRRKTMALSIKDAEVTVRIPARLPMKHAEDFVFSKRRWISQQLARQQPAPAHEYRNGESFLYLGNSYTLLVQNATEKNQVKLLDSQLLLSTKALDPSPEAKARQLMRWYKEQAESYLQERCQQLVTSTRLTPRSVTVKSYKARWGSCRISGDIQLNWKLIMAPATVIDYVIVHELCHLKQHNHSPAFWQLVKTLCPDFQTQRLWLKQHGSQLTL